MVFALRWPHRRQIGRAVRGLVVLGAILAALWAGHVLRETLTVSPMPVTPEQMRNMTVVALVAYVALMAVPFVPGAEIGIALLTAYGAAMAPVIYGATVLALGLAFALGRLLPTGVLIRLLWFFGLKRAAALVARAAELPRSRRVDVLLEGASPGLIALGLRHRYVALALLVNVPGNMIIGGGGGILMLAGLSRLFAPVPTMACMAIGVSPVPLTVFLSGV